MKRVNYYVKLADNVSVDGEVQSKQWKKDRQGSFSCYENVTIEYLHRHRKAKRQHKTYFFDLYRYLRYFPLDKKLNALFGDITVEPLVPAFVKSRPVVADNTNSVLLNLNSVRHFFFVKDTCSFRQKEDKLVSRNVVRQEHRRRFVALYHNHPLCDVGQINRDGAENHPEWIAPYLTIPQQLRYKFVACIEGNDVATNLKWVMASNSLAVMPRPKYETWFMEGTLIPDYHYVAIADDFSDLPQKLNYYINHPEEAEAIIAHAHDFVAQFLNPKEERLVSLLVIDSYFKHTQQ